MGRACSWAGYERVASPWLVGCMSLRRIRRCELWLACARVTISRCFPCSVGDGCEVVCCPRALMGCHISTASGVRYTTASYGGFPLSEPSICASSSVKFLPLRLGIRLAPLLIVRRAGKARKGQVMMGGLNEERVAAAAVMAMASLSRVLSPSISPFPVMLLFCVHSTTLVFGAIIILWWSVTSQPEWRQVTLPILGNPFHCSSPSPDKKGEHVGRPIPRLWFSRHSIGTLCLLGVSPGNLSFKLGVTPNAAK